MKIALRSMGQHAEAVEMFRELLPMQVDVLGAEHPDTLRTKHNLASAVSSMGQRAEAVETPTPPRTKRGLALALGHMGHEAHARRQRPKRPRHCPHHSFSCLCTRCRFGPLREPVMVPL